MKKTTFSKIISLVLALAMVFSLAGCGGTSESDDDDEKSSSEQTSSEDEGGSGAEVSTADKLENEDMQYVLIYNPAIYDEYATKDTSVLKTGYFGSQIEVEDNRGGELEGEITRIPIGQNVLNNDFPWDSVNFEGNRAEGVGYDYDEGDVKEFYIGMDTRELEEFECVYAGEYCYVWSNGDGSDSDLRDAGKEFDKNIYEELVETFGMPRFVGESGKVNLLIYSLPDGYGGYFWIRDLFATGEISEREIKQYGCNTDHAIIHINAAYYGTTYFYSTLAHEFQHLICATNIFSTVNEINCSTWMDESMSGYIEEKLYPGAQEDGGHIVSFNESGRIRNGQSLYNFDCTMENFNMDIGVYGSVYYFAEYLAKYSGESVFSNFHEYWRESYSKTLCVAESLVNSVSSSYKKRVNNLISYPSSLSFNSDDEEFLSKMTLDFYLTSLSKDTEISAFENINHRTLLYDNLDETSIEGGGRIILKVKNGSFEIPEDADAGLIYIGLDSDFNPVTDFICK